MNNTTSTNVMNVTEAPNVTDVMTSTLAVLLANTTDSMSSARVSPADTSSSQLLSTVPQADSSTEQIQNSLHEVLKANDPLDKVYNIVLPPILLLFGIVGNYWLVVNFCTSQRLRDNMASRFMCHCTYFNTVELLITGVRHWIMGLALFDIRSASRNLCKIISIGVGSVQLPSTWTIMFCALVRLMYMLWPRVMLTYTSERINIKAVTVAVYFACFLVSVGSIGHHLKYDKPSTNTSMAYVSMHGVEEECSVPAQIFNYNTLISRMYIWPLWAAVLWCVAVAVVTVVYRFRPPEFLTQYRRYGYLTRLIFIRTFLAVLFRAVPRVIVSEQNEGGNIAPGFMSIVDLLTLLDCVVTNYVFLIDPMYRHDARYIGCAYIRGREPKIEELLSATPSILANHQKFSASYLSLISTEGLQNAQASQNTRTKSKSKQLTRMNMIKRSISMKKSK